MSGYIICRLVYNVVGPIQAYFVLIWPRGAKRLLLFLPGILLLFLLDMKVRRLNLLALEL